MDRVVVAALAAIAVGAHARPSVGQGDAEDDAVYDWTGGIEEDSEDLPEAKDAFRDVDERWQRQLLVEGHFGVGTPVGSMGAMVEVTGVPFWGLAAGVGGGLSGVQWAAQMRGRWPLRAVAVAAGMGLSSGDYAEPAIWGCCQGETAVATWFNTDVQFEVRTGRGFNFRTYLGHGAPLAGARHGILYLGTAFGYAFAPDLF